MIRMCLISLSLALFASTNVHAAAHEGENHGAEHAAVAPTASKPVAAANGAMQYGDAMPESAAIALAQALKDPSKLLTQSVKLSGRIGSVCQAKGCWLMLTDGDQAVRVHFGEDKFFIPKDSKGQATVYGAFQEIEMSEAHAKHMAEDAGKDPKLVSGKQKEYRVIATSVVLKADA